MMKLPLSLPNKAAATLMPSGAPSSFRDLLRPWSRLQYLLWRVRKGGEPLVVDLRSGLRLSVRPLPATDYGVAYDIFLRQCYRSPEPLDQVRTIVDLGSNVGYSCLFWSQAYPGARIQAFEPHPAHVELIARNLALNGAADHVEVHPVAVGIEPGTAHLSDSGSSSAVRDTAELGKKASYPVPVVDLFSTVTGPIDLLKIDIEGGEYALLADERFGALNARAVVVEWHRRGDGTGEGEADRAWCEAALQRWGYRTARGVEDLPLAGLVWGSR